MRVLPNNWIAELLNCPRQGNSTFYNLKRMVIGEVATHHQHLHATESLMRMEKVVDFSLSIFSSVVAIQKSYGIPAHICQRSSSNASICNPVNAPSHTILKVNLCINHLIKSLERSRNNDLISGSFN